MKNRKISDLFGERLKEIKQNKNIRLKIKRIVFDHNKRVPSIVTMLLLAGFFLSVGLIKNPNSFVGAKLNQVINVSAVLSGPDLNNLDFKNVEHYNVPNSTKTVIYIPQLHKEPTSNASDPLNDKALLVQKEISGMLRTLVDKNHVPYVMDETDLYGPMPADKIQKIKNGFAKIDQLRADVKTATEKYVKDGGSQDTANKMLADANTTIDGYERNIYLTGGAAALAATDGNAHVYGSQNLATINEARDQLQNIVYLEGRIKELESSQGGAQTASASGGQSGSSSSILSMLGSGNKSSNANPLKPMKDFAKEKNDADLQGDLDKITSESKSIASATNYETAPASTTPTSAPANPYKNRTDLAALKQEDKTATDKFMKVAKDQRSQEVADNVVKMMDENDQNSAVLVFGMQHKDQIVSALNKKGVNVIVITPESENN